MPISDHPLRRELNDEVHARPPEALQAPLRLSYLTLVSGWDQADSERAMVAELAASSGAIQPKPRSTHFSAELAAFGIKWERHSEFSRYTFITRAPSAELFAHPAIARVPQEWLDRLPGTRLVATNVEVVRPGTLPDNYDDMAARHFAGNTLVGSVIADGVGAAFTDFRIHDDGAGRLIVEDRGMTARQTGRMVQRLLEIDTYRMMALLALPIARELAPQLTAWEEELAQINFDLVEAKEPHEPLLLQRLTRLSAEIDSRQAAHHFRFSAAAAYNNIVQRRILELREVRIQGLQTFSEFTERRLAPAIDTCQAAAGRQASLSQRVAHATQLLSTRVDLTREQQNQTLLRSMDRRARLQLRLQQTVEGLSAAAITYYAAGLVAGFAKGLKSLGLHIDPDLAGAVSIPIMAAITVLGVHRIRQMISKPDA